MRRLGSFKVELGTKLWVRVEDKSVIKETDLRNWRKSIASRIIGLKHQNRLTSPGLILMLLIVCRGNSNRHSSSKDNRQWEGGKSKGWGSVIGTITSVLSRRVVDLFRNKTGEWTLGVGRRRNSKEMIGPFRQSREEWLIGETLEFSHSRERQRNKRSQVDRKDLNRRLKMMIC